MSLEELLALRETLLDAKLNLTYYIEESDDSDSDEDGDEDGENDSEEEDAVLDDEDDDEDVEAFDWAGEDDHDAFDWADTGENEADKDASEHVKGEIQEDKKEKTTESLLALREELI